MQRCTYKLSDLFRVSPKIHATQSSPRRGFKGFERNRSLSTVYPEWRLDMFIKLYCVIVPLKFISTRTNFVFVLLFIIVLFWILQQTNNHSLLCVTSTSRQNNGIMWTTHLNVLPLFTAKNLKKNKYKRGIPKLSLPPPPSTLTFKQLRVIKRNLACEVISRTFWHNLRVRIPPQIRFVRGESRTMNLPLLSDTSF